MKERTPMFVGRRDIDVNADHRHATSRRLGKSLNVHSATACHRNRQPEHLGTDGRGADSFHADANTPKELGSVRHPDAFIRLSRQRLVNHTKQRVAAMRAG